MRIAAAKLKHGRIVVVTPAGWEVGVAFRPLTPEELEKERDAIDGDLGQLDLALMLCESCVLGDLDGYQRMVEESPLCVMGILTHLVQAAQVVRNDVVKLGSALWKESERNLGSAAASLLAFQSYSGGDWSKEQFAGALMTAESMMHARNTATMIMHYMKAMGKRGR